jgi:hypothetical protein
MDLPPTKSDENQARRASFVFWYFRPVFDRAPLCGTRTATHYPVSPFEPFRGACLCDAGRTDDFNATWTRATKVPGVPSSHFQLLLRLRVSGTRMFPSLA